MTVPHPLRRASVGLMMLVGASLGSPREVQASEFGACRMSPITFYSSEQYPGRTADGTSTVGALARGDWIAAGGSSFRLGDVVDVDGIGQYRIADRGHLSADQVDILVWTTAEAIQLGRQYRRVCVVEQ